MAKSVGEQASKLANRNGLLRTLNEADQKLVLAGAVEVTLERGQVLFHPGDDVEHVHFPCGTAIVALVIEMPDGQVAEAGTVGREGAIGGIVSQGNLPAFARAEVHVTGTALRISTDHLRNVKQASINIRNLFTRYADCFLAQVLQSVACNALHSIEGRCARWLLSLRDRVGDDCLPVTHQILAEMLGVQRTYLSRVLSSFARRSIIKPGRKTIQIQNGVALEAISCSCYRSVISHYESVLSGIYPSYPDSIKRTGT